jgi:predicted dehydrogenase
LRPELGEQVVVFGLGLVGLLTVQMLVASGVRTIGIDLDADRLQLAAEFGAQVLNPAEGTDPVAAALAMTGGHGVDGVLITASAKNDTIVSQSAQMSRKRGRIVLVGVVNLELNRAEFYEKELTFQVSCSYGPGRYDPRYEQQGLDYPLPFVRWTEQRNIEAVLDLIARGRLDVKRLISHQLPHSEAERAYELLSSGQTQLGVILQYATRPTSRDAVIQQAPKQTRRTATAQSPVVVGMIGAGGFSKGVLLPAIAKTGATLESIASAGGVTAAHAARKFGFRSSCTDYHAILENERINTVFITTRHNLHARMVAEALDAGKHVFVEKPLAIDPEGLQQVCEAYERSAGLQLMVGFNRRFAPHIEKATQLLRGRTGPLCMTMVVNAGFIPPDHWTQDPQIGGGRILGEGCHWIDLMSFLVGDLVTGVHTDCARDPASGNRRDDCATLSLEFADGSIGSLHYFANGHRSFPKERLTIFVDGKVLELDNFRVLRGCGWSNFSRFKTWSQDKGHEAECRRFIDRIAEGGPPLIPFAQLENVTRISLRAAHPQSALQHHGGGESASDERPIGVEG